jgi:integrase
VFPDVSLSTLLRHWGKAARAIGRPELTRRDMRRSFARIAIDSGNSESVVAKLGGWTDPRMLHRYNVRSRKDQADGSARMDAYLSDLDRRLTATQNATPEKGGA